MSVKLAIVDFFDDLPDGKALCFDKFISRLTARSLDEVESVLREVEDYSKKGCYAVGYVCYEAASAFDAAMKTHQPGEALPLAEFMISQSPCSENQYKKILEIDGEFAFEDFTPAWTQQQYTRRIEKALAHIAAGDTYQINLTFALNSLFSGDALSCYKHLSGAQSASYCGCLLTDDYKILSASPELFFTRRDGTLTARPMKGTRRRGMTSAEDKLIAAELAASLKDRAENSMIVDLLRNDLGRICVDGTVRVQDAFRCEKYPTLWQMTSTVRAACGGGATLADIFRAIFPCGSVTGAPKIKTTEIIASLENEPRGVYCGAFGVVMPGGDCVFNVPIRTLTIFGDNQCVYNVGSGVVADSDAADEYEECLLKSRILSPGFSVSLKNFSLLETMKFSASDGFYLLDEHIERLSQSAEFFDFPCNAVKIRQQLLRLSDSLQSDKRVRLLLNGSGEIEIESFDFVATAVDEVKSVRLADRPIDSLQNPFVYNKTTNRVHYDYFRSNLEGAFEMVLYNTRGEITEGTITNIAISLDGKWITPPVSCGLLAGLQRQLLLDSGEIFEGVIHVEDLKRCDGIKIFNSLRGVMDAKLIQ